MNIQWLDEVKDDELEQKTVFCRVDFNVPMNTDGSIADDTRIIEALPTIRKLLRCNCKVVLASHLGRPNGKFKESLSMEKVAAYLRDLLDIELIFVHDSASAGVVKIIKNANLGSLIFLENLRFSPGEENNDIVFSKLLSRGIDVYINEAFSCSHREHASIVGITKFIDKKIGGLLLKKEVQFFDNFLYKSKKPFIAIIDGAKVSNKIGVLSQLIKKVDCLLIGGAMAYTFLKAQGYSVGASLVEDDKLGVAKTLLNTARELGVKVLLPVDNLVCENLANKTGVCVMPSNTILPKQIGVDIGPKTISMFVDEISRASTIFCNGPVGIFSEAEFSNGTKAVLQAMADSTGLSVVGGGDSILALQSLNLMDKISFVSTGGGASLEFLEGKELPGLKALL